MPSRRSVLLLALVIIAVLAGALVARLLSAPPLPLEGGTWLPTARPIAPFTLSDLQGHEFTAASLRGHPTLVFFGFTYCPDICPTTLATVADVMRRAALPGAQVVFITIDPARDTAENLKQYIGAFSHDFIGLRGTAEALAPVMQSLGAIALRQELPDGSYTMDHSATLYLIDSRARLSAVFTPPLDAARLDRDLRLIVQSARL